MSDNNKVIGRDIRMTLRLAFDIMKAEDACKNEGIGPSGEDWVRLVETAGDLLLMNGIDPTGIWHSSKNAL